LPGWLTLPGSLSLPGSLAACSLPVSRFGLAVLRLTRL